MHRCSTPATSTAPVSRPPAPDPGVSTVPSVLPSPVPRVYGPPKPPPLPPTSDYKDIKDLAKDPAMRGQTTAGWIEGRAVDPSIRESIYTTYGADNETPDKLVEAGHPPESVTTPDGKTVTVAEKQVRAANDFALWGEHVLGSDEATRRHFEGIKPVRDGSHMLLANGARQRYQAAVADYEAANDGLTMVESGSSTELRDRHQSREVVGKLGHPLGFAFDIQATSNPNLADSRDEYALNRYMLEKFGADPANPGVKGRATMDRPGERAGKASLESRIERMGKHDKLDKNDQSTLEQVRTEYNEMRDTSDNFRKSLPQANIGNLQQVKESYFQYREKLAQLEKDPTNLALHAEVDQLKPSISKGMAKEFSPWKARLDSENRTADATIQSKSSDLDNLTHASDELETLHDAELDQFAKQHGFTSRAAFETARRARAAKRDKRVHKGPATYEADLRAQIGGHIRDDKQTIQEQQDIEKVNTALAQKLQDPARVFGGALHKNGTYTAADAVSEVPVMQFLENGFCNDFAANSTDARGKQAVHNVDTVAALARRGFSPGATFGDTMHFDYIQGYNDEIVDGRASRATFGPLGRFEPKASK